MSDAVVEIKDAVAKKGSYSTRLDDRRLVLAYQRKTFSRSTVISSSQPCALDEHGLTFQLQLGPHRSWTTGLDVVPEVLGATEDGETGPSLAWQTRRPRTNMARNLERWLDQAPRLECDWEPLKITDRRSLVDLAALRFSPISAGRHSLPAAGLPWFMTMFGRDSILTSLQALPFTQELAATTPSCAAPAWPAWSGVVPSWPRPWSARRPI